MDTKEIMQDPMLPPDERQWDLTPINAIEWSSKVFIDGEDVTNCSYGVSFTRCEVGCYAYQRDAEGRITLNDDQPVQIRKGKIEVRMECAS